MCDIERNVYFIKTVGKRDLKKYIFGSNEDVTQLLVGVSSPN